MSDDFFDDDPFSDDFDDDVLAEEDNTAERLAAFDKEVDRRMKIILTRKRDLDERVEAAYWLGNSGAPKAITALRKVYRGDKNPQMKRATAYALGQFKALDEAIERDFGDSVLEALGEERNAHVVELLQEIALGDTSGSSKPSGGWVRRLVGILTFTLIILVALNAVLLGGGTGEDDPADEPTFTDPLAAAFAEATENPNVVVVDAANYELLNTIRLSTNELERAAASLNTIYATAVEPATDADTTSETSPSLPTCPLTITVPEDITVPPAEVNIGDIATNHNLVALDLRMLREQTETVICTEGRPFNEGEVTRNQLILDNVTTTITTIREGITAQLPTTLATATPAPEVTAEPVVPTETPTPVTEPSLEPIVERGYVSDLIGIITQVNARDGAATLLLQYWEDVEASGRTVGCNLPQPAIPVLDAVPDDVLLDPDDTLERSWQQLINGLDQLQAGWDLFRAACDNPDGIGTQLALGIATARNARDLITASNTLLLGTGTTAPPNSEG